MCAEIQELTIRLGDTASPVERTSAGILADAIASCLGGKPTVSTGAPAGGDVLIGTPTSCGLIRDMAGRLRLDGLGEEGFLVTPGAGGDGRYLLVAAGGARGVLYASAAVADRLRLGQPLMEIALRDRPVLADRNLWIWGSPKSRPDAFFSIDRMRIDPAEAGYDAFGRYLAQARINAVTLWPDFKCRPDTEDVPDETLEAYRALTRFLRERYGVECYLFMWYEVRQGTPTPIVGWPICPFEERVVSYWRNRIGRLIRDLPDLRGIVMAGAGGDWIRGPWECQCEKCRQHTDRELLLRAMEMIGRPWAEAGGRIIWKAVTDRPTLVGSEVEHFADLDDVLPPYVQIAHKPFYKDFRPPHPLHPLFFAHEDQQERVRPYLCEFQIYGEYRGADDFPCVMIDRWAQIAPLLAKKGYAGAMGICSFDGKRWDHPLNMANWYAFGRYAWNPNESPDAIHRDWAALTFGPRAAEAVIEIARLSYQASMKLMFFKGVMTQNHSKLPTIDYELESSLIGPWHDIPKAADGYIGRAHDVSMYPAAVAEQIRSDPGLLLWAHRVPITPELCDEAIAEKGEALRLVQEMAGKWSAIPHEGWADLHREVAEQFRRNLVDAELWYECHRLYFDYKAGRLTRTELGRRLDDIETRFDPKAGSGLIRETFERFIEEWWRVHDGRRTRYSMPGLYRNPDGEPFLPGLKPE